MKKFMATLCTLLMVMCVSFAFVGCIDDDKSDKKLSVSNEKNFNRLYRISWIYC